MDEEIEKPFPIEYFVILLIVAAANDIARAFFLLLDFTGVGVGGEAIMEPANAVLDFFFIGVFYWRTKSFGGSTMTQCGGSLLEFVAPLRIVSVWMGMYLANNPSSILGKIATTAASLESGNVGGIAGKAEGAAGTLENEAANAEKKLQAGGENVGEKTAEGELKTAEGEKSNAKPGESESPEGENEADAGENKNAAEENNVFKNPLDNPVGSAGEEEFNPSEDTLREGAGFNSGDNGVDKAA